MKLEGCFIEVENRVVRSKNSCLLNGSFRLF
jgi:hypothetical protein